MPDSKRTLQFAASTDNETLRPEPPADLWEQLDAIQAECLRRFDMRPGPEWFSAKEYVQAKGCSASTATERLRRLYELGKLERHGIAARGYFYRVVAKGEQKARTVKAYI